LNALPHIVHTYFLSSLCVSLCFVSADALLNTFPQTCDREAAGCCNSDVGENYTPVPARIVAPSRLRSRR
jgi:hypothetical protein